MSEITHSNHNNMKEKKRKEEQGRETGKKMVHNRWRDLTMSVKPSAREQRSFAVCSKYEWRCCSDRFAWKHF